MLFAGIALATAGFIVPPTGEISDSVLMSGTCPLTAWGRIFVYGAMVDEELHITQRESIFIYYFINNSFEKLNAVLTKKVW